MMFSFIRCTGMTHAMSALHHLKLSAALCLLACLSGLLSAQSILDLPAVIVSGEHGNVAQLHSDFDGTLFSANQIEEQTPALLDDLLRSRVDFATWRNLSGAIAHPTSQGMQLRPVGTNATSRALLLLDGIPVNDDFGGWIHWARFQMNALQEVRMNHAGTASHWGNFSAGGAVLLRSKSAFDSVASLELEAGNPDAHRISLFLPWRATDAFAVSAGLQHYENQGFYTLRSRDRGAVDQRAGVSANSYRTRVEWRAASDWKAALSVDFHEETRRNGTPLNRNHTESWLVGAVLHRAFEQDQWLQVRGYLQDLAFDNVFSSVAADRNSEIPALHQFDVPARSLGWNALWQLHSSPSRSLQVGAEGRWIDGEVNEYFRNLGDGFTRLRRAGGSQETLSLFADYEESLGERLSWNLQLRMDWHELADGFRDEFVHPTGEALVQQDYPDRTFEHWNGSGSLHYRMSEQQWLHVRLFQGYRIPTLNELYRPFRVRNDITESNAQLEPERFRGWEVGWHWEPRPSTHLQLQFYRYSLHSMIANVVLTRESGAHPEYGFIPPGGSFSRRESIERSRSQGLQLEWEQEFGSSWKSSLSYLWSDTQILRSAFAELVGSAFAQNPSHSFAASLTWEARVDWSATLSWRASSSRYESLAEVGKLDAMQQLDIGVRYRLNDDWRLSLQIQNVLDREIQTGIASDGLLSVGLPRTVRLTLLTEF